MDIQLPEFDGYEATRKIREFNQDVVIIAQTAFAMSTDKQKALDAGCNDYISKPVLKEALFEKLEVLLVITSYSIHYTKLYDRFLRALRLSSWPTGPVLATPALGRPGSDLFEQQDHLSLLLAQ